MLTIRMKLVEVDYEKLAERFIPEVFVNDTEEVGLAKKLAGKLFVKDGETSSFTKGIMKLIPNQVTSTVAYQLVLHNQARFQVLINQALKKSLQGISVENLKFLNSERTVYDMLKLEIELKEVDYNLVVSQLLPKLLTGISNNTGKSGQLGELLLGLGGKTDQMLQAALDILSQEEKDELLVKIFSIYQADIIKSLNNIAEQQKISAVVADVTLTNKD